MSKKLGILVSAIAVIALCLSVAALCLATKAEDPTTGDIQYVMYLGTNDKDTNEPVFSPEESLERAKEILIGHFGGYTIQEANGGWADGEHVYQEYTMVIYLSDTTQEQIYAATTDDI